MPEEPDNKDFKPAQRKILVATDDEAESEPKKKPAVKTIASREPSAVPVLKQAALPEKAPEEPPTPAPLPESDKTSFPPNAAADQLPAVDLEALRRQYHIPMGRVARKFSPRRHWGVLGLVIVLVVVAAAWFLLEPQL